ncbi:uncharacterized protein LOC144103746 [Amblyomma americanum]
MPAPPSKMNRWAIIGRTFDLTGPQAAAKFKNVKDRWLKIVSASEGSRKSGAGGEAGKVHTKWTLFDIVDGMLRSTPHYAERSSSNVPPEEDISILTSPLSSNSPSSPRLVASCISSPAAALFQEMYSDSPNDFTDETCFLHDINGSIFIFSIGSPAHQKVRHLLLALQGCQLHKQEPLPQIQGLPKGEHPVYLPLGTGMVHISCGI